MMSDEKGEKTGRGHKNSVSVNRGIEAAEKLGAFVARFIASPLEQGVGIFEDKLRYMRWERQIRLMQRADKFLKDSGLSEPTKRLQIKFAIPLFQAASIEDDDYLQDLWAKLLVNAANSSSGVQQNRAYIDILERLNPFEAKMLERIYSVPFSEAQHSGILTKDLPHDVSIQYDESKEDIGMPNSEVQIALANLAQLGVISVGRSLGGGEIFSIVNPTLLGKKFIESCAVPTGKGSDC